MTSPLTFQVQRGGPGPARLPRRGAQRRQRDRGAAPVGNVPWENHGEPWKVGCSSMMSMANHRKTIGKA